MYFTVRQSSSLSSEYVKVLLILKVSLYEFFIPFHLTIQILQLVYDLQTCVVFIIAPVFPCKAVFLKGMGVYLRMNGHIPFVRSVVFIITLKSFIQVINLTTLSMICAWFNCCLFHRHQVILPFDHRLKVWQIIRLPYSCNIYSFNQEESMVYIS